jgi:FAD-linked oxidoreductase
MATEWRNWTGDQVCRPAEIVTPSNLRDLCDVIKRVAAAGLPVRASAAGHSFTDIACTDGVMVRLDRFNRLLDIDPDSGLVKVEAGIGLRQLNERLDERGRALENLGDIDRQTLAGALSTATHGTGARFRNMSSLVEGMELVIGDGSVVELSADSGGGGLLAARAGLGALGIIATVTLRTVPAFTIRRVDSPKPLDETLETFDQLADRNDHFEFYVFPHTRVALVRESERTSQPARPKGRAGEYLQEVVLENYAMDVLARFGRRFPSQIPRLARFAASTLGSATKTDRSFRVYASERRIRFTEMEYGIPRRHGPEAVRRVLELIEKRDLDVSFPIEVRVVEGDDASCLSPSSQRDTCYIAVHMYRGMEWEPYFRGVEEIMDSYEGRPHWGKRHFQTAETLEPRYPAWKEFAAIRDRFDPERRFRNAYTDRVLGP